jgi:hypothetical protein
MEVLGLKQAGMGTSVQMPSASTGNERDSVVGRFFRNPRTGDVVLFQMPNVPLWTFLAATAARLLFEPHGTVATAVSIVATSSLAIWAALEVVRGESPFRRVLGGVVLVAVIAGMLTR